MDFNYSTDAITAGNVLTIGGTGGMRVPTGATNQRPVSGLVPGIIRY